MRINDFFTLDSRNLQRTFQAHPIKLITGRKITNDLFWGNYEGVEFPVVFKQIYGKKIEDMLDTGTVSLHLISKRFKTLLEQSKLTGWKTFSIQVLDKDGEELKDYYGWTITGRCGNIDTEKSEIVKKQSGFNGPFIDYRKGLYIGLNQWDGSDFFCPNGTIYTIVTKKAAEIITENKISNISLENLADIEIMVY